MTKFSLIVAQDLQGGIGIDNSVPWKLPADMKRFKEITSGHYIIMGRKTFDSLPFVLPNRIHIVISKQPCRDLMEYNPRYGHKDVHVVPQFGDVIDLCENEEEVFIIGGGQIYKYAFELEIVDKIYLTEVQTMIYCDTFLRPEIEMNRWNLQESKFIPCDEKINLIQNL